MAPAHANPAGNRNKLLEGGGRAAKAVKYGYIACLGIGAILTGTLNFMRNFFQFLAIFVKNTPLDTIYTGLNYEAGR